MLLIVIGLAASANASEVDQGRLLFHDPGLARRGVSCNTCHATTRNGQGDGLIRAGHSLFDVARRPYWRGDAQKSEFKNLGAAVVPCYDIYMGERPAPRLQSAIVAYIGSLRSRSKQRPAALQLQPSLEADGNYDLPKYRNGRADLGRGLFYRACHSCHPFGTRQGIGEVVAGVPRARVAAKIREGTGLMRGKRVPGLWMPFYGADRLTDEDIADIAAFIDSLPKPRAVSPQ